MPRRTKLHYGWIVAAVTFVVLLSTSSIRAIPGLMMVPLQSEFGWSPAAVASGFRLNILRYGFSDHSRWRSWTASACDGCWGC